MPLVDLSAPISPDPPEYPDLLRTEIAYEDHAAGARAIETLFGVGPELLRAGEGWAVDTFMRFGTHNSTHVDAPWHYNSTIGGERAQTIDELPLDWFYAPGIIVEATDREDGEAFERGRRRRAPAAPAGRARHRPRPHRARRLLRPARLHRAGTRSDRRGHPLAL